MKIKCIPKNEKSLDFLVIGDKNVNKYSIWLGINGDFSKITKEKLACYFPSEIHEYIFNWYDLEFYSTIQKLKSLMTKELIKEQLKYEKAKKFDFVSCQKRIDRLTKFIYE